MEREKSSHATGWREHEGGGAQKIRRGVEMGDEGFESKKVVIESSKGEQMFNFDMRDVHGHFRMHHATRHGIRIKGVWEEGRVILCA